MYLKCSIKKNSTRAGGISSFVRPVNIFFQIARLNSPCFLKLSAIRLAASIPTVFPSKLRDIKLSHLSISSVTTSAGMMNQ